jgi:hypothetical protein
MTSGTSTQNAQASANTQQQAQGQQARFNVSDFSIYYDFHSNNVLLVWPEEDIHILNEHNHLSALIENCHNTNAALEQARQQCVNVIDAAPTPQQVNQQRWQESLARYDEEQRRANAAQEAFRAVIEELSPLEQADTPAAKAAMFRSGGPKKIAELLPVLHVNTQNGRTPVGFGRTVRYVRTDVQGSDKWIVTPLNRDTHNPPANGGVPKESFIVNGKFDAQEFKRQILNLKTELAAKYQFDLTKYLPEDWQMRDDTLTEWAAWANSHLQTGDLRSEHGGIVFNAAAQFMRYTHGVALKGDLDFKNRRVNLKAEGRAELSLLEGKSTLKMNVPDERGWMLSMPPREGLNADLGLLRFQFEVILQGTVGAGISAEVGIQIDGGRVRHSPSQHDVAPPALEGSPTPYRRSDAKAIDRTDGNVDASLSAFVGAQATADFGVAVEWRKPEDGHKYQPFAEVVAGAAVSVGAGIEFALKVGFDTSGLYFEVKAALCWGAGGKGSLRLRVDALLIGEFLLWFVHQLRNVDFQKLEDLITSDDFAALCHLQYLLVCGIRVLETVQVFSATIDSLKDEYNLAKNRTKLTQEINANPDRLKLTNPETKGMILALLAESNFADEYWFWSNQNNNLLEGEAWLIGALKRRKKAILHAFRWIQSRSEYRNVLQHMNVDPLAPKGDWQANEQKLMAFLDSGEINIPGVRVISTDYDGDLRKLIEEMPELSQEDSVLFWRTIQEYSNKTLDFFKGLYAALPEGANVGYPLCSAYDVMCSHMNEPGAAYAANGAEHPLFRGGDVPPTPQYAILDRRNHPYGNGDGNGGTYTA